MTDIYFEIDSHILVQGFWKVDIEDKKRLIDKELKRYIILKIQQLGNKMICNTDYQEMNVPDLFRVLAELIPKEDHFDTIRHFTHYILNVAGNLQGWSITWYVEDDELLIEKPLIEFDEENRWTELKTHNQTNYIVAFLATYSAFQNYFMCKDKTKSLQDIVES